MLKYCIKRILKLVPVLLILTLMIFTLMYFTPGDPALVKLATQGTPITEELLEKTRLEMGLDKPFLPRYLSWLSGILRGDFGTSFAKNMPIFPMMMDAVKHTLILAVTSIVFSVIIAVPLGVLTAIRKDQLLDNVVRIFTFTGNAMPNFLICMFLMYLLCIKFNLFSVIASGSLQGLLLPVLSMSIPVISKIARQTRADVLNQLGEEYVIGMHARGVKETIILGRNVLHNALGGIVTLISLQFRLLLSGAVIIEMIFRWPGVGSLIMEAINGRDYPVVQGTVIIIATLQILVNLVTDISYCLIDSRITLE